MHSAREHTTPMPPITLVGDGRVGGSLFRALRAAGMDVELTGWEGVADRATEVVLLCVPDSEIASACKSAVSAAPGLRFAGHTSGATTLDALAAFAALELVDRHRR